MDMYQPEQGNAGPKERATKSYVINICSTGLNSERNQIQTASNRSGHFVIKDKTLFYKPNLETEHILLYSKYKRTVGGNSALKIISTILSLPNDSKGMMKDSINQRKQENKLITMKMSLRLKTIYKFLASQMLYG